MFPCAWAGIWPRQCFHSCTATPDMNGLNRELEQKPLKGLWLMNKPMLEQAHPQRNCNPWRIHAGTSAMRGWCCNSITWSKGKRGADCNAFTINLNIYTCCNPWLELYIVGSDIAGTTQMNGGTTSEGIGQVSWWQPEMSLLLNSTTSLVFYSELLL